MEINLIKSRFLRNLFDQNTYVISNENEAVIIDAGCEIEDLTSVLGEKKLLGILITHLHFDHIWSIEKIIEKYNCPIFIRKGFFDKFLDSNKNASFVIKRDLKFNVPSEKILYYDDYKQPQQKEDDVTANSHIELGNFNFDIFYTPGHSADCVCIKLLDNLFLGDTIFCSGVGRTDLYDSSEDNIINSLNKILNIDFETGYPGHYDTVTKSQVKNIIVTYLLD